MSAALANSSLPCPEFYLHACQPTALGRHQISALAHVRSLSTHSVSPLLQESDDRPGNGFFRTPRRCLSSNPNAHTAQAFHSTCASERRSQLQRKLQVCKPVSN